MLDIHTDSLSLSPKWYRMATLHSTGPALGITGHLKVMEVCGRLCRDDTQTMYPVLQKDLSRPRIKCL